MQLFHKLVKNLPISLEFYQFLIQLNVVVMENYQKLYFIIIIGRNIIEIIERNQFL